MRVLQLARSRVLIWARERGANGAAFEASRAVEGPLLPRCASAPRCPGSKGPIDPDAIPPSSCPYAFSRVGECVEHRNRRALEAGLFRPEEARLARRLLEAVGYEVEVEAVDPLAGDAGRILRAHRPLSQKSDVRVFQAPYGGRIVLVRDTHDASRRPAGGRT